MSPRRRVVPHGPAPWSVISRANGSGFVAKQNHENMAWLLKKLA